MKKIIFTLLIGSLSLSLAHAAELSSAEKGVYAWEQFALTVGEHNIKALKDSSDGNTAFKATILYDQLQQLADFVPDITELTQEFNLRFFSDWYEANSIQETTEWQFKELNDAEGYEKAHSYFFNLAQTIESIELLLEQARTKETVDLYDDRGELSGTVSLEELNIALLVAQNLRDEFAETTQLLMTECIRCYYQHVLNQLGVTESDE